MRVPDLGAVAGWVATGCRDALALRRSEPRDASFEVDGARHWAAIYGSGPPRPGVLLLHTAAGLTRHDRATARRLERCGFTTMVVRYSGRTRGTAVIPDEGACQRIEGICRAAFERLGSDRAVDPEKVAIFGLSLGGYFAVRLAGPGTGPCPAAVAVWYGVYRSGLPSILRLRSPLLIVQGTQDAPSFTRAAQEAAALAPDRVKLVSCPGLVHQFDVFQPLSRDTQLAWRRTVAFLRDPYRGNA